MNDFAQAVATLQGYAQRAQSRNYVLAERYDEALNDIVRNPGRSGSATELVDISLANARKKLAHRAAVMPRPATPTLELLGPLGGLGIAVAADLSEPVGWPQALRPRTRRLLGLTALGFRPRDLAVLDATSPAQARVALCRARAEGRSLFAAEVAA